MEEDESGDVAVCELAYYTGEFGALGKSLTADVVFPVEEVINEDPPLGRTWKMYHEDLGTVGEAQAARTCLDRHNADIVVSIAHGYRTYRDLMMQRWQEQDGPLVPSVHGGAIPGNLGGKAEEPIFRAQGLDEALGTSGVMYAEETGAKSVVIFATNVEGFQLAADAAERTAEQPRHRGPRAHRRRSGAAVVRRGGPADRRAEARRGHRPGEPRRVGHPHQAGHRGRHLPGLDRRDRHGPARVHQDAGHRSAQGPEGRRLRRVRLQRRHARVGVLLGPVGVERLRRRLRPGLATPTTTRPTT